MILYKYFLKKTTHKRIITSQNLIRSENKYILCTRQTRPKCTLCNLQGITQINNALFIKTEDVIPPLIHLISEK